MPYVLALAAAVRFATLGTQSYQQDEAVTVALLRRDFGAMLDALPASESTPPLYYVLAWPWTQLFGTGEVALRSLSAVFGVAFVYVAFRVTERLATRRAALIVGTLAAVSPFLVWYAQEARAYALVALLCALSLWAFLAGRLWWWALTSAAALATHYFAVFPVAAEAVLLLARDRRAWRAIAVVGAAGLALLPLALDQLGRENFAPLLESSGSLAKRIAQVPKQFLLGYDGPWELGTGVLAIVLCLLAFRWRRAALPVAGIAAFTLAAPVVLALLGTDVVIARNLIVAWLPLAVVLGARARLVPAIALCVLSATVLVAQVIEPAYQRDDWRAAARALGHTDQPRQVVILGPGDVTTLAAYRRSARPAAGESVGEIAVITMTRDGFRVERFPAPHAVPGAEQIAYLPPGG